MALLHFIFHTKNKYCKEGINHVHSENIDKITAVLYCLQLALRRRNNLYTTYDWVGSVMSGAMTDVCPVSWAGLPLLTLICRSASPTFCYFTSSTWVYSQGVMMSSPCFPEEGSCPRPHESCTAPCLILVHDRDNRVHNRDSQCTGHIYPWDTEFYRIITKISRVMCSGVRIMAVSDVAVVIHPALPRPP